MNMLQSQLITLHVGCQEAFAELSEHTTPLLIENCAEYSAFV